MELIFWDEGDSLEAAFKQRQRDKLVAASQLVSVAGEMESTFGKSAFLYLAEVHQMNSRDFELYLKHRFSVLGYLCFTENLEKLRIDYIEYCRFSIDYNTITGEFYPIEFNFHPKLKRLSEGMNTMKLTGKSREELREMFIKLFGIVQIDINLPTRSRILRCKNPKH